VELLVAASLLSVVFAGLFVVLNIGHTVEYKSSAWVDLYSNQREVMAAIMQDLRSGLVSNINSYGFSDSYLEFNPVIGYDGSKTIHSTYTFKWDYDSITDKLTRQVWSPDSTSATKDLLSEREFSNILEAPFYTKDSSGDWTVLSSAEFMNQDVGVLIVQLISDREIRGNTFTVTSQGLIKVRNE